jgi:magnesium transporter
MTNTLYLPELREMLAGNNTAELTEFCTALHPARTAEFMEGLTAEEAWAVLRHAEYPQRAEIFSYFERQKQVETIQRFDRKEIGDLIAHLHPDDRVDLLKEVDPEVVSELLPLLPAADRRDILRLRSYPENMAGAMMTTDFARVSENLTVREALEELGRQAGELETIYYIYVVDDQEHLLGLVSARQLVSAIGRPQTLVRDLMERELVTVDVNDDVEEVAHRVARFDLLAIPVVDQEHHILGIVTHDDVIDIVVEEATEDVHRMGAVGPIVENVLEASFLTIWRKRAGWLSLLFVAELFTFTALARFENAIQAVLALSLFVPLCISTGGNSGSQAATLITRALAVGQVTVADWWRVLRHELTMGLALGATLGIIGFFRAAATPQSVLGSADRWLLALVIATAVATICLWGTLVGSMLPIIFKRLGVDPGFASSPFVATFVDVTGIVIYFSIAQILLLGTAHPG